MDSLSAELWLGIGIAVVSLVGWAVRVEMRGRSNQHRIDTLEHDAKEDTKDWRIAQEKIDAEVGNLVKVTYLMAGKMGVDIPLD